MKNARVPHAGFRERALQCATITMNVPSAIIIMFLRTARIKYLKIVLVLSKSNHDCIMYIVYKHVKQILFAVISFHITLKLKLIR